MYATKFIEYFICGLTDLLERTFLPPSFQDSRFGELQSHIDHSVVDSTILVVCGRIDIISQTTLIVTNKVYIIIPSCLVDDCPF
jgi:hypothetical protein